MRRLAFSLLLTLFCATGPLLGETFPRDLRVDVILNQVGFAPGAAKKCVLKAPGPERFEVIRATDQKVVFSGPLAASNGDFGGFLVGDSAPSEKRLMALLQSG